MFLRNALDVIFRFLLWLFARIDAAGVENIPESGGAILATNHLSRVDAPLIYVHIKRRDVTGLAADKYLRYPLMRIIINAVNGIWIDRENPAPSSLREAIHHLQNGGLLGIAPEGTRSQTGQLLPAKAGAALLATKASVPIVPIAVWGTEKVVRQFYRFKRTRLYIRFGKPFMLQPLERKDRDGSLQRNADEIMCQIAAMLPPEYRGAYAAHPRLFEILQEIEQQHPS